MKSPTKLLIGLSLMAAPVACGYGERHYDEYDNVQEAAECGGEPRDVDIDTDELMESDPGEGVGVFVEYAAEGWWHVFMTCDSNKSRKPCYFDVFAYSLDSKGILSVAQDSLESEDDEISYRPDSLQVVTVTDNDFDGFYLQAEPGAELNIDVLLDGVCYTDFIYWVDGGEVRNGYVSTPLRLKPSSP